MEKLIKLLNEYEATKVIRDYTWRIEKQNETRICGTEYTGAYIDDEETERIVISKKYKFIEWLVMKNKIDLEKLLKAFKENKIYCGKWGKIRNMLLMLLAIQDEPIGFLLSILR